MLVTQGDFVVTIISLVGKAFPCRPPKLPSNVACWSRAPRVSVGQLAAIVKRNSICCRVICNLLPHSTTQNKPKP